MSIKKINIIVYFSYLTISIISDIQQVNNFIVKGMLDSVLEMLQEKQCALTNK